MAKAGTKLPDGSAFFTAIVPTFHGGKAGRKSRSPHRPKDDPPQSDPLILMLKITTKANDKFVVEVLAQGHCAEESSS